MKIGQVLPVASSEKMIYVLKK